MATTVEELKDGKLPPTIFLKGKRWYSGHSNDPAPDDAETYIEVVNSCHTSIRFLTKGKRSGVQYRQRFMKVGITAAEWYRRGLAEARREVA